MEAEVSKDKGVTGQGVAVFWKVLKLLKEERVSQLVLAVRWRAVERLKSGVSSVSKSVWRE